MQTDCLTKHVAASLAIYKLVKLVALHIVATATCPDSVQIGMGMTSFCSAADVNSLTSAETELPFDYYSLPFCKPAEGARKSLNSINPGTILMGSRIQNSPYNFTMLVGL